MVASYLEAILWLLLQGRVEPYLLSHPFPTIGYFDFFRYIVHRAKSMYLERTKQFIIWNERSNLHGKQIKDHRVKINQINDCKTVQFIIPETCPDEAVILWTIVHNLKSRTYLSSMTNK